MAITTGAADKGLLTLDVGGRSRAGNGGGGDGDSFASTLDTQMQKPRAEQPRAEGPAKAAPKAREPEPKERGQEQAAASDEEVVEEKAAATGEAADQETAAEDSERGQILTAILLQTAPDSPEKTATEAGFALGGGKKLPPAATQATAPPTTTLPAQTGAERGAAAVPASGAPVDPTADRRSAAVVPAAETALVDSPEGAAEGEAARIRTTPVESSTKAADPLLQAARLAGGAQASAPKGETSDAFAATLAALRDAAPRGGREAAAQVNAPVAPAVATPTAPGTPSAVAPELPAVNVPVGQQGWDRVVGERVLWMTRQGMQEAKIELNPRDLGPIEVRVSVQQDQASVAFTAQTPAAREALEAAMPRLREMLADSGLNLAQSDVSHRSPQQQQESGWGNGGRQGSSGTPAGMGEENVAAVETRLPSLGAVDYYA